MLMAMSRKSSKIAVDREEETRLRALLKQGFAKDTCKPAG